MRVIRLGTRGSALARWQSDFIAARLTAAHPDTRIDLVEISSIGDQLTQVPLSHVEGTGFFTSTLEQALLAGEIDVAVHSYKDLPVEQTPGLHVAAVPPRAPANDVLCARFGTTLRDLPSRAKVGTCSTRRTAQLHALRPDLEPVALRGNVPTRLERVTRGELDAVVLAQAGLVRLGLTAHVSEVFPLERMLPAPAQGALAVQCRADDADVTRRLAALDDPAARRAVDAERMLLHSLGGGCSVPVGACAQGTDRHLALVAGVFHMEPHRSVRVQVLGDDPAALARQAAARLLALGAEAILAEFDKAPRAPLLSGDAR
jgi:hydroxymethylbilane synthase